MEVGIWKKLIDIADELLKTSKLIVLPKQKKAAYKKHMLPKR
jgi:hypothetical protein